VSPASVRPGRGALRAARTLLVAVPSVTLSAAAHAATGGCITAVGVLLTAVVVGLSTWTQVSRERSVVFLLAWLTLGQVVGHGLFELGCHGPAHAAAATGPQMVTLHGASVLLSALILAVGESRVWRLARALSALPVRLRHVAAHLARLETPRLPVLPSRPATSRPPFRWQKSLWCSPRPVRRGPPVALRPCL
jgi:hypothetical protein